MIPGRCSACDGAAEQNPLTGRWWHLLDPCPNTSMTVFSPVEHGRDADGTVWMGPAPASRLPARFVAEVAA